MAFLRIAYIDCLDNNADRTLKIVPSSRNDIQRVVGFASEALIWNPEVLSIFWAKTAAFWTPICPTKKGKSDEIKTYQKIICSLFISACEH
jgi:hypothetical protein